jgi:hypothetical protein
LNLSDIRKVSCTETLIDRASDNLIRHLPGRTLMSTSLAPSMSPVLRASFSATTGAQGLTVLFSSSHVPRASRKLPVYPSTRPPSTGYKA